MAGHIVHSYDNELSILRKEIIDMGFLVKEIFNISYQALQEKDSDYIEISEEIDIKINEFDETIEKQATKILALRQPMAIDLREAVSALKLAVMMERMGDLCKNTAKRAAKIEINISPIISEKINKMSILINDMLDQTLQAYKDNNIETARPIAQQDEEVDNIYYSLLERIKSEMLIDSNLVISYTQLLLSIKNIERIGDYTAKIANMLIYIITGERVAKISKRFT